MTGSNTIKNLSRVASININRLKKSRDIFLQIFQNGVFFNMLILIAFFLILGGRYRQFF